MPELADAPLRTRLHAYLELAEQTANPATRASLFLTALLAGPPDEQLEPEIGDPVKRRISVRVPQGPRVGTEQLLRAVEEHPGLTTAEIAKATGCHHRTVRRWLPELGAKHVNGGWQLHAA